MGQRFTVAFADAGSEIAGVAIAGAGMLLAQVGELTAAAAPLLEGAEPSWTLRAPGACELELVALATGATFASGARIWLCRASGDCMGRDLSGLATVTGDGDAEFAMTRSIAIAFDERLAFALEAGRPRGASGHGEEQLEAVVFRGEPPAAAPLERPRLSTTYGAAGLPRHAGIELWESEDAEFPVRIGGEAVASGELLDAGGARSRVVFMAWHHHEHRATGSYTITSAP